MKLKTLFLMFFGAIIFCSTAVLASTMQENDVGKNPTKNSVIMVNQSAPQMTMVADISKLQELSLDVGIPAYEQSFSSAVTPVAQEATVNYALKEAVLRIFFVRDIRATWVSKVGVLSFKTQAKLTSSVSNLDSKNQPDQESYFQTRV